MGQEKSGILTRMPLLRCGRIKRINPSSQLTNLTLNTGVKERKMTKFLIAATITMTCMTAAPVHAQDIQGVAPTAYYVDSTCNTAVIGGYYVGWLKNDPAYNDFVMVVGNSAISGVPINLYISWGTTVCGAAKVSAAMFGHW